jgi:hypothetical protein
LDYEGKIKVDDLDGDRRKLDTYISTLIQVLREDKRIGEQGLELLLDNAYKVSEYSIDRLKLRCQTDIADMYRFCHHEYLKMFRAGLLGLDRKYKKKGYRVAEINIDVFNKDLCKEYFDLWFTEKGGSDDKMD